jgi:hypothetical protein
LPTTSDQPSTRTKKTTLNGSETITGGSIIMPIDISTQATTMSMTRNGTKIRKPISNARRSSLIENAGSRILSSTSSRPAGAGHARDLVEQGEILVAHLGQHEAAERGHGAGEALGLVDLLRHHRLHPLAPRLLERGRHHEPVRNSASPIRTGFGGVC